MAHAFIRPPALRAGDRVAIVAPSSPFEPADLEDGAAELRRLGFAPVYDESVFERRGYVAGEPSVRAGAFMKAWRDPEVAAVIAVRGGYGSAQMLPWLDRDAVRQTPKVLVGYSDVTALLAFVTTGCGLVAFHGPMLAGKLARGPAGYDRASFRRCL